MTIYHNDHLGTPQKLTTASGVVVWSARYDAFGAATVDIHAVENNLRFPGQYYDAESGLHYNWYRYYDPDIGRYLRVDPSNFKQAIGSPVPYLLHTRLKTPQELHEYAYVSNSPINYYDENGLDRYNPCNNLPWIAEKICRKYVYWACSGPKNFVCCEAEKSECLSKNRCEDPDFDKKNAECLAEHIKCIANTEL